MVIKIPINTPNGYTEINRDMLDIATLVDKIHRKFLEFIKTFGNRPDSIIINETDLLFINEYLRIKNYQNFSSTPQLFGLKVQKMKAKGFVFSYE